MEAVYKNTTIPKIVGWWYHFFQVSLDSSNISIHAINPFEGDGLSSTSSNLLTYSLTPGPGDNDNLYFALEGNQLKLLGSPDYELKSQYD